MIYEPKIFQYRFPTNIENINSSYSEPHNRYFSLDECIVSERFLVEQFTTRVCEDGEVSFQWKTYKDLYVGDVVNFYENEKKFMGVVVYSEYYAGFGISYIDDGYPSVVSLADPFACFSSVKIIGNVNENLELLATDLRNVIILNKLDEHE